MSDQPKVDRTRRNLIVATSVVGGAAAIGAAVPFVASMWPSERAKAAGAPVEIDISRIAPGARVGSSLPRMAPGGLAVFEWRGKPVWVMRRTKAMLDAIQQANPRVSD